MIQTKKTAGYALMVGTLAAGAWIAATAFGSGEANPTEATPADVDAAGAVYARFVEPTSVDYGTQVEPR
jgi:hypothetical protein